MSHPQSVKYGEERLNLARVRNLLCSPLDTIWFSSKSSFVYTQVSGNRIATLKRAANGSKKGWDRGFKFTLL